MRTKRLMLRVGCGLGWGLVVCLGLVTHLGAEQAAPRRPDRLELAERSEFQPIDAEAVAITSAIVALARSLRLEIVAEGVENDAEEEFLHSLQCFVVQGFLHARPMFSQDFERWRRERPWT